METKFMNNYFLMSLSNKLSKKMHYISLVKTFNSEFFSLLPTNLQKLVSVMLLDYCYTYKYTPLRLWITNAEGTCHVTK